MKFNIDGLFCEVIGKLVSGTETKDDLATALYYIIKSNLTMEDYYKIYDIVFNTEKKRITKLFIDIESDWRKKNGNDFISYSDYLQLYNAVIKYNLYSDFPDFCDRLYSPIRPESFNDSILYENLGVVGFSLGHFIEGVLEIKKLSKQAFFMKYNNNINSIY